MLCFMKNHFSNLKDCLKPMLLTLLKVFIPLGQRCQFVARKTFQKSLLVKELEQHSNNFKADKLLFAEHHISHAASAFYPSPFQEAVILTLDGVGEWATTTVSIGKGNNLEIVKKSISLIHLACFIPLLLII